MLENLEIISGDIVQAIETGGKRFYWKLHHALCTLLVVLKWLHSIIGTPLYCSQLVAPRGCYIIGWQ